MEEEGEEGWRATGGGGRRGTPEEELEATGESSADLREEEGREGFSGEFSVDERWRARRCLEMKREGAA